VAPVDNAVPPDAAAYHSTLPTLVLAERLPVKLPHSVASPPEVIVANVFVNSFEIEVKPELVQVVSNLYILLFVVVVGVFVASVNPEADQVVPPSSERVHEYDKPALPDS
jgi:hypothetical protein